MTSGVDSATISGGGETGALNRVTDTGGTVGGGRANQAGNNDGTENDRTYATVSGGRFNVASSVTSTVGGGVDHTASGRDSTIAGGSSNRATGQASTVAGGNNNEANDLYATVSGGRGNIASSRGATVAGGEDNIAAGQNSFAAGRRAQANFDGSFVWGDSTAADVTSSVANEFTVRASGGVRFFSNSGLTTGVTLAAGGGSWASVSDRNLKENFAAVNGEQVLEKVAAIPMQTWNYIAQEDAIRHMGPMAQDFHAAFGLGPDDKHITTIDADGVALAAIQALYKLSQQKDVEIEQQQARIHDQQGQIDELRAAVEALQQRLGLEISDLRK